MKTQLELLTTCAEKLYDAVDMMNDGPDDSDIAYAHARFAEAIEAATQWKRSQKENVHETE